MKWNVSFCLYPFRLRIIDALPIRPHNIRAADTLSTVSHNQSPMSTVQVRLSHRVVTAALATKPDYDTLAAHLSRLIESGLDSAFKLGKARSPTGSQPPRGNEAFTSYLDRRDKENDLQVQNPAIELDLSLRAEEAHVSEEKLKKESKKRGPQREIPGCLLAHQDLITKYWKAKPKTKTEAAWKLLMSQLIKLQDKYGDKITRDQLGLAEAQRWQSITLANYERFGVPVANTPKEAKGAVDWDEVNRMTEAGAFDWGAAS